MTKMKPEESAFDPQNEQFYDLHDELPKQDRPDEELEKPKRGKGKKRRELK
jgi:hypothetical protein